MVFWLQVFKPLTTYRAIYIHIIQIRHFLWVHWIDNNGASMEGNLPVPSGSTTSTACEVPSTVDAVPPRWR